MLVSDIATMTVVKVKEVSTSTYTKIARGMKRISKINFLDRNRRKVAVCLTIWLVANIAGYFVYHFAAVRENERLYERGLTDAQNLATQSGPLVLENDILSLSMAIKDLQNVKDLKFAAIIDHKNNILAHTDNEMINRKFEPLQNEKPIEMIDGIAVTTGISAEKTKVFGFFKNIIFSDVEIGKVYIALSATRLNRELNRFRLLYLSGVVLGIILLIGAVFLLDRIAKARALKVSQDIEKMDQIGPYRLQRKVARGGMAELFLADYVRQDGFRRKVAVKRILLIGAVFLLDRIAKARALKVSQDIEKMDQIGPYRLQRKVARGGMAELFLADYVRQDGFRRKVAVKRILPHLAGNPNFIKMFTREARVAALLQHPNVVQIFDYGQIKNAYFIAMEYIEGKNLGEILSTLKDGLSVDQTVYIVLQICKGLDYSHTKRDDNTGEPFKIVHRDISPQNMLISYQGEVKISDFGISKARSEPSLTQAGVVKGKLAYLSPEQALGEPIDHRADIYALGLVFYEMLTGERVYKFSSDVEAIRTIPKMEIDPLQNSVPQVPEKLNRIVMKCLEKKKDLRYQTVSALYTDLTAFKKEFKITFDTSDLVNFMKKKFNENGKFVPEK